VHAIYANGGKADRDRQTPEHFKPWIEWAKAQGVKLDFNGSFFSHPKASDGFTLSHPDAAIRDFWVRHAKCAREIGEAMGRELGSPCVVNLWIPDGSKDLPADRLAPRQRLKDSLDAAFEKKIDPRHMKDAVECKLFGIGSESYVVGSHEFYLGYALRNKVMPCFDMGHFHPTESVADKISSTLLWCDELLLHVSRGVRWDSDHVVLLGDELRMLAEEITRCDAWGRVNFALDYFDASINRIAAWAVGARAAMKAILISHLEPTALLREAEQKGNLGRRLAVGDAIKTLPFGAVWDKFCLDKGVPHEQAYLARLDEYETSVLSKRR
jgi:L-rhamnose isomerase